MGFISGFSPVSGMSCFSPGNATTKARTRVLKKCDDVDKSGAFPGIPSARATKRGAGSGRARRDQKFRTTKEQSSFNYITSVAAPNNYVLVKFMNKTML